MFINIGKYASFALNTQRPVGATDAFVQLAARAHLTMQTPIDVAAGERKATVPAGKVWQAIATYEKEATPAPKAELPASIFLEALLADAWGVYLALEGDFAAQEAVLDIIQRREEGTGPYFPQYLP